MEQKTKACAMCRKMVDQAATLCPHCRSDIDYQYFVEIPKEKVTKERQPVLEFVSVIVVIGVACFVGFLGFSVGGVWVGIFLALVTLGAGNKMVARGHDMARLVCSGCGHSNEYRWPGESLLAGKQASFECTSCKQKTRLMVQSSNASLSPVMAGN